uniref:Major facilitator superfamily (MFS) profile domain-containing protein n=1 Tax=Kalanchoe fedtschenkoi TaxID=63787 RepID=A0A7N0T8L5_KALFE
MAMNKEKKSAERSNEDGIRDPLIQRQKNLTNTGVGAEAHNSPKEQLWMVYLSTFVAVCGSYDFGVCAGYSSPTQTAIINDMGLSLREFSTFGSILTIGAMIGAVTSGRIADHMGRKGAMRVATTFCVIGWLSIYFSKGAMILDFGRLTTGYGMGVYSYVVPIFVAEISPKNLRGALTTLNQVMICCGVSVSFVTGTILTWRVLALTGLIPCIIVIFGLIFIPESPRWLAKRGYQLEFIDALQKLRGEDADISNESIDIQEYTETLERLPKTNLIDLFQRRYLPSVTIGVGLMVFQQFGGINGICFYVNSIFESAGVSSNRGIVIYSILQVVVTALCSPVIDRAGRKPLLMVSAFGLVIGCLLLGASFYLKNHDMSVDIVPMLALTGILVYIGSFSAGMGAIPWVVMSEIFPINIKGTAGSLATLVNWFGAWVVSYTYNYLYSWSSYGTFLIYATVNALAIVFVIKVMPETKGKTLEQIQAIINS